MIKGFDTAEITTGHAHDIVTAGFGAVGIYLRSDRAPLAMVDGLLSVGIKIFSIWEKGNPVSDEYFGAAQGRSDGTRAGAYAELLRQPRGSQIFTCIDYDPSLEAIEGPLLEYMTAFREALRPSGYLASAYASGLLLSNYIGRGICHSGYLTQSHGFQGYRQFLPHAAIVQGPSQRVLHFDVDLDTVVDESAVWSR